MPSIPHPLPRSPVNLVSSLSLEVGKTYNIQVEVTGGLAIIVESPTEPSDGPKVKNLGWVQVTIEAGIGVWAWSASHGQLWVNDN